MKKETWKDKLNEKDIEHLQEGGKPVSLLRIKSALKAQEKYKVKCVYCQEIGKKLGLI